MPSPSTALQIIEDALGLTNAIGVDQTLTADQSTDGLRILNDLIEDWSLQNLAVWGQANQTFNTIAGQAVYTIGPAGNWNTTRPVWIGSPAYTTLNGVTFPCSPMNQEQYDLIAVKAQPQPYADFYLFVNDFPLGLVTLWPVPDQVLPITFSIERVLTQVATPATVVSFPPGYVNAFKYNLACMLAPRFGKKMANYPDVEMRAARYLGNIKRANRKPVVSQYDSGVLADHYYGDWQRGW